jgi:acyl dehydratase
MTTLYLEDLSEGQRFASGRCRIDEAEIQRFAQEYDPQPFHVDTEAAKTTLFAGLAASGWHTAALTMRLMVDSDFSPAGGIIGAGFDELNWPRPVRPDDELHLLIEILEVRASRSKPDRGMIKVRTTTLNQNDEPVQVSVGNLIVLRKPTDKA